MEAKNNFWSNLIFVVVLVFVAHQFWKNHEERKLSVNWPVTSGKIVHAHLKEVQHTSHDDNKSFFGNSSYTDYEIVISYDYEVDGRNFTGTRIEVSGPSFSRESEAVKVLSSYKEGEIVNVYYNPKNPKASVLVPG